MTENRSYALVFQAAETGSRGREGGGGRQTIAALLFRFICRVREERRRRRVHLSARSVSDERNRGRYGTDDDDDDRGYSLRYMPGKDDGQDDGAGTSAAWRTTPPPPPPPAVQQQPSSLVVFQQPRSLHLFVLARCVYRRWLVTISQ